MQTHRLAVISLFANRSRHKIDFCFLFWIGISLYRKSIRYPGLFQRFNGTVLRNNDIKLLTRVNSGAPLMQNKNKQNKQNQNTDKTEKIMQKQENTVFE